MCHSKKYVNGYEDECWYDRGMSIRQNLKNDGHGYGYSYFYNLELCITCNNYTSNKGKG